MSKNKKEINKNRYPYYRNMPSKEYWYHRAKEQLSSAFNTSDKVEAYLKKRYERSINSLNKQFIALLSPYTDDEGNIDAGKLRAARITNPEFVFRYNQIINKIDFISLELENITQKSIHSSLNKVYKAQVKSLLNQMYEQKIVSKNQLKSFSLELLNPKVVETIVKTPWTADGIEFSERIWKNKLHMNDRLRSLLSDTITKGKSLQKTSKELVNIMGNSYYNCQRLVRTETLAAYTKASRDSYAAAGIEEYECLVEANACDECLSHVGETYKTEELEIGINAPVFHPNCKCCIAPVVKFID